MATEHGCALRAIVTVCDVMYGPCSQEENTADSQVGEQHEEPDSWGEGIEEGEVARLPSLEQTWQMDGHRQADRQTGRRGVREQGVTSEQKGYDPFSPQGGSVPHHHLAPQCSNATIHKCCVSQ